MTADNAEAWGMLYCVYGLYNAVCRAASKRLCALPPVHSFNNSSIYFSLVYFHSLVLFRVITSLHATA